jgi:hypothetical protein
MARNTSHVTRSGDHWIVRVDTEAPKIFATRDAALRAALMYTYDDEGAVPVEIKLLVGKGRKQLISFIATPGVLAFN